MKEKEILAALAQYKKELVLNHIMLMGDGIKEKTTDNAIEALEALFNRFSDRIKTDRSTIDDALFLIEYILSTKDRQIISDNPVFILCKNTKPVLETWDLRDNLFGYGTETLEGLVVQTSCAKKKRRQK